LKADLTRDRFGNVVPARDLPLPDLHDTPEQRAEKMQGLVACSRKMAHEAKRALASAAKRNGSGGRKPNAETLLLRAARAKGMQWREARRALCQHYKRKKLELPSSKRLQTLIETAKRYERSRKSPHQTAEKRNDAE